MVRCPECNSQYHQEVERVDAESGFKMPKGERDLPVWKCANCGHMFTVQDGLPKTFSEARPKKPLSMLQEGVDSPVSEGGPIGERRRKADQARD